MNTSVPIATLAGITSLTDLLPELPFPTPSSSRRKDTLLCSPKVAAEAGEVLNRPDRALVQRLSQALFISKSTTDQLIWKDGSVRMTALLTKETHSFCKLFWPMHQVFLVHRLQVQVPWLTIVKILRLSLLLDTITYHPIRELVQQKQGLQCVQGHQDQSNHSLLTVMLFSTVHQIMLELCDRWHQALTK